MSSRVGLVLAGLLVSAACGGVAPAGAPIPVEGTEADRAALAGDWEGSYATDDGVTRGTIEFQLRGVADTAHGLVEMRFSPPARPCGEAPPAAGELSRPPCTAIDIALIRVIGDSVRGTLPPFWNPACECRSTAVFDGLLARERIAGTFIMRSESGDSVLAIGRWEVGRRSR